MKRQQRFRYEMLVRVRDFGAANKNLFPQSSTGGQMFDRVTEAVAAIAEHLTARDRARVATQRVKAATRHAVTEHLQAIANTARRVATAEAGLNPFKASTSKSATALISRARMFIEEMEQKKEKFERLGLPPAFTAELETMVNDLEQAVTVRLNSRSILLKAQTGIETALAQGFSAVRDLDVIVRNTLRRDPVTLGAWRGARRLEGATRAASSRGKVPASALSTTPVAEPSVDQPAADQPTAQADASTNDAPAPAPVVPSSDAPLMLVPPNDLEKAS